MTWIVALCTIFFVVATPTCASSNFFDRYCNAPSPLDLGAPANMTIVQLHVLHRHGDRAPCNLVTVYMKDISFNCSWEVVQALSPLESFGPYSVTSMVDGNSYKGTCQLGQLTPVGGEQLFSLGSGIRSLYIDKYGLLPQTQNPSPSMIFVHPTPDIRTHQSAASFQNGLYPAATNQWAFGNQDPNYEVLWEPSQCPKVGEINKEILNNASFYEFVESVMTPQVEEVAKALNIPLDLAWEVYNNSVDVWGAMYCHRIPNRLPSWDGPLRYATTHLNFTLMTFSNRLLASWSAAPYLSAMMPSLEAILAGDVNAPRLLEWSGHDDTLMSVLGGLGQLSYTDWPPYAAHLRTEAWRNSTDPSQQYVRMIYNNNILMLPCSRPSDGLCTASDILHFYASLIPDNWRSLCGI